MSPHLGRESQELAHSYVRERERDARRRREVREAWIAYHRRLARVCAALAADHARRARGLRASGPADQEPGSAE